MGVISMIILYTAAVNLIGFAVMGIDKYKAKKHAWRIPESTLFIIALIGGSLGSLLGMYVFRHKTRKWYFAYGIPAIIALQIILIVLFLSLPSEIFIM